MGIASWINPLVALGTLAPPRHRVLSHGDTIAIAREASPAMWVVMGMVVHILTAIQGGNQSISLCQ